MSFNNENLALQGGAPKAPAIYTYYTIDPLARIVSAGYFSEAWLKFKKDDVIFVVTVSGFHTLIVTSSTASAVKIEEQDPLAGLPLTAFSDLRTASITPQVQLTFEYTVDNTELLVNQVSGTGSVTQSTAMAVCSSGATAGSEAYMRSVGKARYRSGLGGLARFTSIFETQFSDSAQISGIADERGSSTYFKNGFMVGWIGGVFGFHRFSNDTLTTVAQADWDDPMDGSGESGLTLAHDTINVFSIRFQYLGGGIIDLNIEDDTSGRLVRVHRIKYANKNTEPSVHNPNFYLTLFASNGATASSATIKSASMAYFVEGKTKYFEGNQPQFTSGEIQKSGVTTKTAVFTIRNKSTYALKSNFIDALLQSVSVNIDALSASNLASVFIVKDATLGGTPSYSDINTTNSVMEIDTAGTTVTGGKEIFPILFSGKSGSEQIDLTSYDITLDPGQSLTIAAESSSLATIGGAILWKELF